MRPSPRPQAKSARVIRPVSVIRSGLVTATPRSTLPATVCLLFLAIDLLLGGAYLADQLAGHPSRVLARLLDLDGEHNLPAWYSSMQWLCAAGVTGIFAFARFDGSPRSWRLVVLPLLFVALSADESISVHEAIGRGSDGLLLGGDRAGTTFARTGLWGLFLGPPLLLFFWGLLRSVRDELERAPEASRRMLLGMTIMLTGAVGLETLSNFIAPGSVLDVLEVFLEEVLEMIGTTIILWGACELLAAYRFAFSLERTGR